MSPAKSTSIFALFEAIMSAPEFHRGGEPGGLWSSDGTGGVGFLRQQDQAIWICY